MPLYTKESLEQLRDRVDLVEVISSHVDLKRSGATFKGCCPFHDEKTPSFMIQTGDKHYHCFGCGAHGDALQFLMQHVKLNFSDACQSLAERFHVKLVEVEGSQEADGPSKPELKRALDLASEFYQFHLLYTPEGEAAIQYLEKRGVSRDFIEKFELGWAPERQGMLKAWLNSKKVSNEIMLAAGILNKSYKEFFSARIQFPIKDPAGAVIGFSGRKIKEETFGGKYINTTETPLFKKSKVLFGLNYCRKRISKEQKAVIVEGQLDCLTLIHAGLNLTVAGQGTAFGEGHARELIQLGVTQVFLALDGDHAGLEATTKIGNLFQKAGVEVKVMELPKGDDPDSYLKRDGIDAFLRLLEESGGYLPFLVRYEARTTNVTTPAGKSALVKKIADQIKQWESPIMVHESLRLLAKLTQVPEEFLGLGEQHSNPMLIKKSGLAGNMDFNPDKRLESALLRWLAYGNEGAFLEKAKNVLKPTDFYSPTCKELFEAILMGDYSSLRPDAQILLEELGKKKVEKEKQDLFFNEILQKILDRNWLRRREEIKIKIQSNRYSEEEVLSLVREFDQLKNRIVI